MCRLDNTRSSSCSLNGTRRRRSRAPTDVRAGHSASAGVLQNRLLRHGTGLPAGPSMSCGNLSLRPVDLANAALSAGRGSRPGASPGRLNTVLTTTTTDNPPVRPTMQIDQYQVSHGLPQPARSLQAGGQRAADQTWTRHQIRSWSTQVRRCAPTASGAVCSMGLSDQLSDNRGNCQWTTADVSGPQRQFNAQPEHVRSA